MIELLTLIRTLYFLKHNCHNLVARDTFFQDHEYLSSSYEMSLKHYDSLVERIIGLGHVPDLVSIQVNASQKLKSIPLSYASNKECFYTILTINKAILQNIEQICKAAEISQGTLQMIGTIADEIEIENYKLGQRIKGNK